MNMFSSRFSQNLFAYFRQPKKYIVSVRLRIDGGWYDRDVEVISHTKKDAQKMAIFKEAQIKKMIDHVASGNISLSQFTQSLNTEAYKYQEKKGDLITMMDVVRTLESFLVHNEPVKNQTEIKVRAFIDYMKSEVVNGSLSHLT